MGQPRLLNWIRCVDGPGLTNQVGWVDLTVWTKGFNSLVAQFEELDGPGRWKQIVKQIESCIRCVDHANQVKPKWDEFGWSQVGVEQSS